MKQTEHYQLNQYEPTDSFLRADFNADNQKLDAALAEIPKAVLGNYQGTQKSDYTAIQTISLGYRPKALFIIPDNGRLFSDGGSYGGLFYDGQPPSRMSLNFTEDGFQVWNQRSDFSYLNLDTHTYIYLAFR